MAHGGSATVQTNEVAFKLNGKHHKNAKELIKRRDIAKTHNTLIT